MRVNIEQKALTDLRFRRIARAMALPWFSIVGAMAYVWDLSEKNDTDTLGADDVDEFLGVDGFCKSAVEFGLMEDVGGDRVRIKGMRERLDDVAAYRKNQSIKGKSGAEKRWHGAIKNNSNGYSSGHGEEIAGAMPEPLKKDGKPMAPMSMSMSSSKSMSPTPSGEEKIRQQSRRDLSPELSANDISEIVAEVVGETKFIESEIVDEKPKRKKKAIEVSAHDLALAERWVSWTKNLSPHVNATVSSFSVAIFETKRSLRRTMPDGDLDGILDGLFDYIQQDSFWSKNCLSPGGLTKKGSNGLRKVDNIITAMRGFEFNNKRNSLMLENSEPMDMSWMKL